MANAIKQANNGFNSIYKGNFSIGINDVGPVMIYNRALTANEVLTNYNNIESSHGY